MKLFDEVLGKRIKKELYLAGMSQRELARIMEVPSRTLWTWISGQRRMTAENLYYISKVVGFSIDEILSGITKEME